MMKQSAQGMIPSRFRTVFGDQAVFGMRRFFDGQLHCIISFDGRIDESRLAKAVRLTLDAEPVLGCQFIERWWRPYWQEEKGSGLPLTYAKVNGSPLCLLDDPLHETVGLAVHSS